MATLVPLNNGWRRVQRQDGGFDFYRGNQKDHLDNYIRETGANRRSLVQDMARHGDQASQRELIAASPTVKQYNSLDVYGQRKRLSELRGLANRDMFNSQADIDNRDWARNELDKISIAGQNKGGNIFTFLQDLGQGTADTYNTAGTGFAGGLFGADNNTVEAQKKWDQGVVDSETIVSNLKNRLNNTTDINERLKLLDSLKTQEELLNVSKANARALNEGINYRGDPTRLAGAYASLGLDIATAGVGGKVIGNAVKGTGSAAQKFLNTLLNPQNIRQGARSGTALGTGYGLAGTAEQLGQDATFEDYLAGGLTGAGTGFLLGAGVPAALRVGNAGRKALGFQTKGEKTLVNQMANDYAVQKAQIITDESARANPKVVNARNLIAQNEAKIQDLINRGFSPNSPDVRMLVKQNAEAEQFARQAYQKTFNELYPQRLKTAVAEAKTQIRKATRQEAGKEIKSVNREVRQFVPGGTLEEDQYIHKTAAEYADSEKFIKDTVDRLWNENKKGSGVDTWLKEVGLGEGTGYDGRGAMSNNSKFYQDYYREFGKKPTKRDIEDMVRQSLDPNHKATVKNVLTEQDVASLDASVYQELKNRESWLSRQGDDPTQSIQSSATQTPSKVADTPEAQLQKTQQSETPQSSQAALTKGADSLPSQNAQVNAQQESGLLKVEKPQEAPVTDRSYIDNTTETVKTRGFVKSVKESAEVSPETSRKVSGEYNVRSTDKLALGADKYSKGGLKRVTSEINERLDTKLGTIDDQTVADALAVAKRLDGLERLDAAQQIYDKLAEHGTKGGQAIQAFSLLKNRTPEGVKFQMLRNLKKAGVELNPTQQKEVAALIDRVRKTKVGTEARDRALFDTLDYVSKRIPTNFGDKVVNFWRAGLLTAPKTTGGNILGNTGEAAVRELWANPVAVAADKFFSVFTGKRTKTLGGGRVSGFKEGVKRGTEYLKTGYDPRTEMTMKYDAPRRVNYKNKVLDGYVNGVYRWMGTQDQPFYYSAKAVAAYDMAKADGLNQGLKGSELANYIEKSVADENWKPQTFKTQKDAAEYGKYAVYQNQTLLGNMASGLKQSANRAHMKWLTDFILPFTQVPASIAMRIIDRTPLGTAREIVSQIKNKRFDQRALVESIGNGSFGIPAVAVGYALSQAGEITGAYPTDANERKLWEQEGKQEYSVKIGDRWYSLNYLQPLGTLMQVGTQINEDKKEGKSEGEAWLNAIAAAAQSISDQSFLQGLNGALSALNDPERSMSSWAKSTAGSLIPNFVRSGATALDDKQRVSKTPVDSFIAGIPGIRTMLPEKLDSFGKTLEAKDSGWNQYFNPLKPSKVKNENNDLTKELRRLQDAKFGVMPTTFTKTSISGVELTDEQVRELNSGINQKVEELWTGAIKDPRYSKLDDEQKSEVLEKLKDNAAKMGKNLFTLANGIETKQKYAPSKVNAFDSVMTNGTKISDKISPEYKDTLTKYEALSSDDREKLFIEENDAEYKYKLAKFENDKANGTLTQAQQLTTQRALRKDKVGSKYSKDIRDLYSVAETELAAWLSEDDGKTDKAKLAKQLLAYDRELYDKGIIKNPKYRGGIASGRGGKRGSSSLSKAISTATSINSRLASSAKDKTQAPTVNTKIAIKKTPLKKYTVARSSAPKITTSKNKIA